MVSCFANYFRIIDSVILFNYGAISVERYKLKIHTVKLIIPSANLGVIVKFLFCSLLSKVKQINLLLFPLKLSENGF